MPPFYGQSPADGLQVLKDAWGQKAYHEEQSKFLANELRQAIDATLEAAPVRRQGFQLSRPVTEAISDNQEERRLEAAMLVRWNKPNMWSIPGAWSRLVSFQVPLFAQQIKSNWGYIDLLGIDGNCLPVVVELKKSPRACEDGKTSSSETPLRMILEAAAYAIALRKNWKEGFRTEWLAHLARLGISDEIVRQTPKDLTTVPLVAAAPASFWMDWLPFTDKGRSIACWNEFARLLDTLCEYQLPVAFVSISGEASLLNTLAAQSLSRLPWSTPLTDA
jgi:hypothetical protein